MIQMNMTVWKVISIDHFLKLLSIISTFSTFLVPIYKISDEGDTNMKHGHDYVDYDSATLNCSKFLGVLKYCGLSL